MLLYFCIIFRNAFFTSGDLQCSIRVPSWTCRTSGYLFILVSDGLAAGGVTDLDVKTEKVSSRTFASVIPSLIACSALAFRSVLPTLKYLRALRHLNPSYKVLTRSASRYIDLGEQEGGPSLRCVGRRRRTPGSTCDFNLLNSI